MASLSETPHSLHEVYDHLKWVTEIDGVESDAALIKAADDKEFAEERINLFITINSIKQSAEGALVKIIVD